MTAQLLLIMHLNRWYWADSLFHVQQALDCKMTIDVEEYVSSFRPEMMDFAADWCNGATFKDIQKRSDFFEVN